MSKKPNLIIIGATKAGTTALRNNLSLHEHISFWMRKPPERDYGEIKFFNQHWDRKVGELGLDGAMAWYEGHFEDLDTRWFGEKSAGYFQGKESIRHLGESYPEARLILLMREPVSRLWSHAQHNMRKAKERADAAGETHPEEHWRSIPRDFIESPGRGAIEKGDYILSIERLLEFFPREQLFLGVSERFMAHGDEELAKVYRWLDLEPLPEKRESSDYRVNKDKYDRISDEQAARWTAHYRESVERLKAFLDNDLPEWKRFADVPAASR